MELRLVLALLLVGCAAPKPQAPTQAAGPKNQKVREFAVIGHKKLAADLKTGQGGFLDALLNLLKIPARERPQAVKRLQELSAAHPKAADFAAQAAEAFPDTPAPKTSDWAWEYLREQGAPEEHWAYLVKAPLEAAKAKTKDLPPGARKRLTQHVVDTAGKTTMSWTYNLREGLTSDERLYAGWHLREYTLYKP